MDWNLLGLSFLAVFLSELGDKSQLAAIALGGTSKSPWMVFLGTVTALILTTFLAVWIGEGTAALLPTEWVKGAAAGGFTLMAIRLLWPRASSPDKPLEGSLPGETIEERIEDGI